MTKPTGTPALLTPAEVATVIGGLTGGDFWRLNELSGGARTTAILEALHRAGVRHGLADADDPAAFLDRIELTQIMGFLGGGNIPLGSAAGDGESSPPSADTGDSRPET